MNTDGAFHCECLRGYAGPRCEMDVNECHSDPCQNDATCLDKIGGFTCLCMPGTRAGWRAGAAPETPTRASRRRGAQVWRGRAACAVSTQFSAVAGFPATGTPLRSEAALGFWELRRPS